MTPTEEYANEIVTGLNSFLDHSEFTIELLQSIEKDDSTKLVFGDADANVSADIEADDSYSFEDGGYFFTFGIADQKYLIIETDIENVKSIDCKEHVGEAIGCYIEAG